MEEISLHLSLRRASRGKIPVEAFVFWALQPEKKVSSLGWFAVKKAAK
jgi:hypothetical protein